MEQNTNVSFRFFDQALVQRVIDFTELSADAKTKETTNTLKEEIKNVLSLIESNIKRPGLQMQLRLFH